MSTPDRRLFGYINIPVAIDLTDTDEAKSANPAKMSPAEIGRLLQSVVAVIANSDAPTLMARRTLCVDGIEATIDPSTHRRARFSIGERRAEKYARDWRRDPHDEGLEDRTHQIDGRVFETPVERWDDRGEPAERHESWGLARMSRQSGGGHGLFDTNVTHPHTIALEISTASRRRSLGRDWKTREDELIELVFTPQQWGELLSSANDGTGAPCTINRRDNMQVPRAQNDEPRLRASSREVEQAAAEKLAELQAAVGALADAFGNKAGRKEMATLIGNVTRIVGQAPGSFRFIADQLNEHVEDAAAELFGMLEAKAHALGTSWGIPPEQILDGHRTNELTAGDDGA